MSLSIQSSAIPDSAPKARPATLYSTLVRHARKLMPKSADKDSSAAPPRSPPASDHLSRLPPELLLAITAQLPTSDTASLSLTSSLLHRTLAVPHSALAVADEQALAAYLHRDALFALYAAERHAALPKGHLVCPPCRTSHPRARFDLSQHSLPAPQRTCTAAQRQLFLCAHVVLDFPALRAAVARAPRGGRLNLCRAACHVERRLAGSSTYGASVLTLGEAGDVTLYHGEFLYGETPGQALDVARLARALQARARALCPHRRLGDARFVEELQWRACACGMEPCECGVSISVPRGCGTEGCAVAAKVMKFKTFDTWEGEDDVRFTLEMPLGRVRSAWDAAWLVHTTAGPDEMLAGRSGKV